MVTIARNGHTLSVTLGAFHGLYEPMGYTIKEAEEATEGLLAPDGVITTPDQEDELTSNSEGSEEDPNDYDDEEDDLEEKPLSEMNFKELKEYASRLGINVNGMGSKKDLRLAIIEAENAD